MRHPSIHPHGFSSILAMLMTAFLLVLASGVLALVMREWRIGHSVYRGIVSYAGAEGSLEYGLLKVSRYRDGFQDAVTDADYDRGLLASNPSDIRRASDTLISYTMRNSGNAYSGTIRAGAFEVIPLFVDVGEPLQTTSKHPNPTTPRSVVKTDIFRIQPTNGDLVWNMIGRDPTTGATVGMVGTGAALGTFGNDATVAPPNDSGTMKRLSGAEFLRDTYSITNFVTAYDDNYIILYNPSSADVTYTMSSHRDFSFPVRDVIASATVADMRQNLEFREDRSRLFDALKYSVFNR